MLRNALIVICATATITLHIWCLYMFLLDESISLVDYKGYHTIEIDTYPSISLCLNRPFIDPESNLLVSKMNATTFKHFISGRKFENRMNSISYDNVTIDPRLYLMNISMVSSKSTYVYIGDLLNGDSWKPSFYISKRSLEVKCITFDIPFLHNELIETFEIEFNDSLIASCELSAVNCIHRERSIILSYPNQSLISSIKPHDPHHGNHEEDFVVDDVQLNVSMIDVLTRRNTRNVHCTNDWKNHDILYQEQLVKHVGCCPIYWTTTLKFPICNEKEQYFLLEQLINKKIDTYNFEIFTPPCRQMMKSMTIYGDPEKKNYGTTFKVSIRFDDAKYRESKQLKAFDFQSLIGNGGGYLGMILGIALFHLPDLFRTMFQLGKKMIRLKVDGVSQLNYHSNPRTILMKCSINVFYGLCIFSTFYMASWYTCLYVADEDTSQVDFVPFNEDESSIYPSISLCFEHPFSSAKFNNTDIPINESSYKSVLSGEYWDETILDINYDDMTLDINDHLFEIRIQSTDSREYVYSPNSKTGKEWKPIYYTSRRKLQEKCITFNMPFIEKVHITKFEIVLNVTIFDYIRHDYFKDYYVINYLYLGRRMHLTLHYPGQLMTSSKKLFTMIPRFELLDLVLGEIPNTLNFDIETVETVTRRNKHSQRCIENWKQHDDLVHLEIMQNVHCRPVHWNDNSLKLPICSDSKVYLDLDKNFFGPQESSQHIPVPCKTIEKIYSSHKFDYASFSNAEDFLSSQYTLSVNFQTKNYMKIEQIRAIDFQSVVGNIGGYLGLFIGCSLLQVPKMICDFASWLNGQCSKESEKRRKKKTHCNNGNTNLADKILGAVQYMSASPPCIQFELNTNVKHIMKASFMFVCFLAATCTSVHWISEYLVDNDSTNVNFVEFCSKPHRIYPAITLCFDNPYVDEQLRLIGHDINTSSYYNFVSGKSFDWRMMDISYDTVTLKIENHLLQFRIQNSKIEPLVYVSKRHADEKCFTFDINSKIKKHITTVDIVLNATMFDCQLTILKYELAYTFNKTAPKEFDINCTRQMYMIISYPRQITSSITRTKRFGQIDRYNKGETETEKYDNWNGFDFVFENMETVIRRNKRNNVCNEEWQNHDNFIANQAIKERKCQPVHWSIDSGAHNCTKKEDYAWFNQRFGKNIHSLDKYPLPCQRIENIFFKDHINDGIKSLSESRRKREIDYDYGDYDENETDPDFSGDDEYWTDDDFDDFDDNWRMEFLNLTRRKLTFSFSFQDSTYTEIKQLKALSLQSLIGNVGGYLGLFLGLNVLQVYDGVLYFLRWFNRGTLLQ